MPVVARYLFDLDLPLEAAAAKRVGLLVRWLHQHGASDQDVGTFVRWYRKRHPGAALPRAEATFAEHWTRWQQSNQRKPAPSAHDYLVQSDQILARLTR